MRVKLRGIAKVRAKGRDYYYAWRGGPRLEGEPGSPEFIASYHTAHKARQTVSPEMFHTVIASYKGSREFGALRDRTRADYLKCIGNIETEFGDMPLTVLDDPRVTRDLLEWRSKVSASAKWADYHWTVLMRLMSWGRQCGLTSYQPPPRISRLYHADRSAMVWTVPNIEAFLVKASVPLQRAMVLALYTGQRQGDLLALTWTAYDGQWIRLRQSKTGVNVPIPVHSRLKAVLDATPRNTLTILADGKQRPWKGNAFRKAWGAAGKAAGIMGLTFHDLRGTAVTRLSEAGCTHSEIAAITGHSQRDVGAILDRYTARTDKLASAGMAKLERGGS